MINEIFNAFPSLTDSQREQFRALTLLYPEWNAKINVISRKDIDNLCVNHILHSLAIAKFLSFTPNSSIMDLGTGGGFPGIPLAIMFPDVKFHLIDRIAKKLRVAESIAASINLENVTFQHADAGECHEKYDFVVSRAVMPQPDLVKIIKKNISTDNRNAIPNGLITLKGGDIIKELGKLTSVSEIIPISDYFPQEYFDTKLIVYTPVKGF